MRRFQRQNDFRWEPLRKEGLGSTDPREPEASHLRSCSGTSVRSNNRTLAPEIIGQRIFADADDCQEDFDRLREIYNLRRPHEAISILP